MAAADWCARVIWLDDGGPLVSEPCAREAGHDGPCRESTFHLAGMRPHARELLVAPIESIRAERRGREALLLARAAARSPRWGREDHAAMVLALAEDDPRRLAYERVAEELA